MILGKPSKIKNVSIFFFGGGGLTFLAPTRSSGSYFVCLCVPFVNSELFLHAVSWLSLDSLSAVSQLSLSCLSDVFQLSFSCLSAVFQLSLSCLSAVSQLSLCCTLAIYQHSLPISQLFLRTLSGQVFHYSQCMLIPNSRNPKYFVLFNI